MNLELVLFQDHQAHAGPALLGRTLQNDPHMLEILLSTVIDSHLSTLCMSLQDHEAHAKAAAQ